LGQITLYRAVLARDLDLAHLDIGIVGLYRDAAGTALGHGRCLLLLVGGLRGGAAERRQ
jgi:hypothetical protein